MARTTSQIDAEITAAIQSKTALSGLTSTSQTSAWRQFKDAIVSALQVTDQLGDIQLANMNKIADEAVPGTPSWLQRQTLNFQYGDTINLNADLTFSYTTIDTTKRIVTRVSVQQLDITREILLKVAKGNTGALSPLSTAELSALRAYINRIKFAGTHIRPISLAADRIVTEFEIYYSGELVESVVKANVIAAIEAYYANLPFDGALVLSKLIDSIQAVTGVQDVVLNSAIARPATTALNDPTLSEIQRLYYSQAGYIVSETAAGSTLNDTITMNPV